MGEQQDRRAGAHGQPSVPGRNDAEGAQRTQTPSGLPHRKKSPPKAQASLDQGPGDLFATIHYCFFLSPITHHSASGPSLTESSLTPFDPASALGDHHHHHHSLHYLQSILTHAYPGGSCPSAALFCTPFYHLSIPDGRTPLPAALGPFP